jgi:hypothetical protein
VRLPSFAAFSITTSVTVWLLSLSAGAAAQSYRPESFERPEAAPALSLGLSSTLVQSLNSERDYDIRSFEAFGGGKRGIDRFGAGHTSERIEGWKFYGRFYLLNFQNVLGETPLAETQITFRRTGPGIAGRVYVGVTKRW